MASVRCALILLAVAVAQAAHSQGNVVQQVIEMLQENKMKTVADLNHEEAEMVEFFRYCDTESSEMKHSVDTAGRKIRDLEASIWDYKSKIDSDAEDIAALGREMAEKERELAVLEAQRKAEKADFVTTEKELEESLDELDKSVMVAKREAAGAPAATPEGSAAATEAAAGFLQTKGRRPAQKALAEELSKTLGTVINAAWVDQGSSTVLKNFLQQQEGSEDGDASLSLAAGRARASTTEHKDFNIITTLEDMKLKAEESLSAARQKDMRGNHNFQMLKQSIVDAMGVLKEKLSDTKTSKASLEEARGKANGEVADVKKTKLSDSIALDQLKAECSNTQRTWAERQASAKGEVVAIDKAIEILGDVKSLVQRGDDDYLQGDASADAPDTVEGTSLRRKLTEHLRDMGHQFNSYALAELASAAASDPMAKVKGLLKDMVDKLTKAANEEATQKAFCDEEKAKSAKAKDGKSDRADELKNRVERAKAAQAELSEDIKELQTEIAESDAAMGEATTMRAEEEKTHAQESGDYKAGADAVEAAVKTLRDYYASVPAALVQSRASRAPTVGSANTGSGMAIVNILENMGAEFAKMHMEVEADEQEAAAAFKQLTQKNKVARAAKVAEIAGAQSEIKSLEVSVRQNGKDLKMTLKELDAILAYVEKLKPQCETKVMSYEEKVAKKQAEITGLKDALTMLDGPAF